MASLLSSLSGSTTAAGGATGGIGSVGAGAGATGTGAGVGGFSAGAGLGGASSLAGTSAFGGGALPAFAGLNTPVGASFGASLGNAALGAADLGLGGLGGFKFSDLASGLANHEINSGNIASLIIRQLAGQLPGGTGDIASNFLQNIFRIAPPGGEGGSGQAPAPYQNAQPMPLPGNAAQQNPGTIGAFLKGL